MSISSAPRLNRTSSAPACAICSAVLPFCPGTKPKSSAPTRAAAVCSTENPFQSSLIAPVERAALLAAIDIRHAEPPHQPFQREHLLDGGEVAGDSANTIRFGRFHA